MNPLSLSLYETLYTVRRAEQAIIAWYPQDDMKTPMHMSMGQEAIPVAVCHALAAEDQVFATYRSHAAFLAKTGDVDRFFGELYGKETGTAQGKAGSMHLADCRKGYVCSSAIVASCIPVAVGASFAHKRQGDGLISCVFFGDGAVDEGVAWESLNVACVMRLPTLFVCEDNSLAVHTATAVRRGYRSLADVVGAYDCAVFAADTTDVEALHRLAAEAIGAIRRTGRPAFLHARCYRYLEHVGIHDDFDAGYRSREEFERWFARDCVLLQRQRLFEQGGAEAEVRRLEAGIDGRIEAAIQRAKAAAFPPRGALYQGVFYEGD